MNANIEKLNNRESGNEEISETLGKKTKRILKLVKYLYENPFLTTNEIYEKSKLYDNLDYRTMEYDVGHLIYLEIFKKIDGKICFFDYTPLEYELEKLYSLNRDLFPNPDVRQRFKIGYSDMFKRTTDSGLIIDKVITKVIEFIGFEVNSDTISRFKKFVKIKNKDCVFVESQP